MAAKIIKSLGREKGIQLKIELDRQETIEIVFDLGMLYNAGMRIRAIKIYMRLFGVSLMAAKDSLVFVEGSYSRSVKLVDDLVSIKKGK